ncbi:MAG: sigma 54-interacting transcriptional regulator [Thiotrichales bacterium]
MYGSKSSSADTLRPILIYGDDLDCYRTGLGNATWRLLPARNSAELRRHLHDPGLRVAVLSLDRDAERTLDLIEHIREHRCEIACIVTLDAERLRDPSVRERIGHSCFDYLVKPLRGDLLRYAAGHAHGLRMLRAPRRKPRPDRAETLNILGEDARVLALREQVRRVARAEAPVLIGGESGTGKELVARAIHNQSPRRDKPFIAINMGALTESLAQSELFGHEKGAFTGAVGRHLGIVEAANGGTVFLDEIGDLSPGIQTSLLRFLQEKVIQRIGNTEPIEVDVRVLAATHIDLRKAVIERRFREDLYFRLNVLNLILPPLRERGNDVLFLAEHFFSLHCTGSNCSATGFSQAARRALVEHPWPGNVRELINVIQRATVMAQGELVTPEDLGFEEPAERSTPLRLAEVRQAAESEAIRRALYENDYNLSATARVLDISRVTLYRLMEQYGLSKPDTRIAAG